MGHSPVDPGKVKLTRGELAKLLDQASLIKKEYEAKGSRGTLSASEADDYKRRYAQIDHVLDNYELVDEPPEIPVYVEKRRAYMVMASIAGSVEAVASRVYAFCVDQIETWKEYNRLQREFEREKTELRQERERESIRQKELADSKIVCPQCQARGHVTTTPMVEVVTETTELGVILPSSSTREVSRTPYTDAYCSNCDTAWRF